MNQIPFVEAGGRVRGRFTDNNFIEIESEDGMLGCNLSIFNYGDTRPLDGCVVVVPETARGSIVVHFGDDNGRVILGRQTSCNIDVRLWRTSSVVIGDHTTANGCRIVCDDSDVVIGEDCMLSDEVLLQSSDQHGLIDLDSGALFNDRRRSVVIEDHVWIGRRAVLMPDVRIGRGAVIGGGALVARNVEPFTYQVGVPARQTHERSSWTRDPRGMSPREASFFQANGFPIG